MSRIILLLVTVALVVGRRQRSEPNGWFIDLIVEDQQHDSHDHSGSAAPRENHTCCHRLAFDTDPTTGDLLEQSHVPYNHWWRSAAMLVSLSPNMNGPSERLVELDALGMKLDFRTHSVLYVRMQCAFPCCLEAASILIPDAAHDLIVSAGNVTHEVKAWRLDRLTHLPPGYHYVANHNSHHEAMWRVPNTLDRLSGLQLCDTDATGMWMRLESTSRIEATLAEVDICFIHHDMVLGWETDLCEESTVYEI